MQEYEINDDTLALVSVGDNCTEVYEKEHIFHVNKNITQVMDDSCLFFGSSLDGRKKGTERLIGITYKAPIVVEESHELIFFPTCSERYHKDISWIGLKHIRSYYPDEYNNQKTIVEFQNGMKIPFSIRYASIDHQILRATRLESAIRGRKTRKKRFK